MVVHCLEIITSMDYPAQRARQDLATFRENHSEVLGTQAIELEQKGWTSYTPVLTEHYHAMFRFSWDESLLQLRSNAETWLQSNFSWWAWRYHECDHDEGPEPGGCEWTAQNTNGNVPQDVIDHYS